MEFAEYLISKKIDPIKFKEGQPERFTEWYLLFNEVHPDSFTQQKLFLINHTRRTFPYKDETIIKKPTASKGLRPKIKPLKPKTK